MIPTSGEIAFGFGVRRGRRLTAGGRRFAASSCRSRQLFGSARGGDDHAARRRIRGGPVARKSRHDHRRPLQVASANRRRRHGNRLDEGPTAAASPMAVAAKDPPSADRLALGVRLVVAAQKAVANQRANRFAMRTRHLLESFRKRAPFLLATAKPALLAHVRPMPRENR